MPEELPVEKWQPSTPAQWAEARAKFFSDWLICENGNAVCIVNAVSHDAALHKATVELMQKRGIKGTPYIDGPYTVLRNTLSAEKVTAT